MTRHEATISVGASDDHSGTTDRWGQDALHEHHLIPIEVTAAGDPDLLTELVRNILAEGLAQYHEYGDLDPFPRLTVHLGATIALDDATLARRSAALSARGFWKLLDYRANPPADAPAHQLAMPGLGGG